MIEDVDMKVKSDNELLGMWANQNEFVDGIVDRVRAEIKRRGLDIRTVRVRSIDEKSQGAGLTTAGFPIKIRGKLPRILFATFIGVATGAAFYDLVGVFAWSAMHNWPLVGLVPYFAVWLAGPPIIAVGTGMSMYRKVSR